MRLRRNFEFGDFDDPVLQRLSDQPAPLEGLARHGPQVDAERTGSTIGLQAEFVALSVIRLHRRLPIDLLGQILVQASGQEHGVR